MRRGRRARCLLAAALVAAALGGAGLACPSRDLTVEITANGTDTLLTVCDNPLGVCELPQCAVCDIDGGAWKPQQTMGVRLLLLQVAPESITIVNQGTPLCFPLNLRPCLTDFCGPSDAGERNCIAELVSKTVAGALGSGQSFPGFTSTDGVALALAFYQKPPSDPGGNATCDPASPVSLVTPGDCHVAELAAVAGLSNLSGSSTLDITCASCQGGPRYAAGADNASCPIILPDAASGEGGACFLQRVAAALALTEWGK